MTSVDLITIATLVLAIMVTTLWIVTPYLAAEDRGYMRRWRRADADQSTFTSRSLSADRA